MEDSNRSSTIEGSSGVVSAHSLPSDIDQRSEASEPELLWYKRFLSECCLAWGDVIDLWRIRDCRGKFYAILSFVVLPFRVIRRTASPHVNTTIPDHESLCYLFVLTCFTLVLNLVELDGKNSRRDIFVASCMIFAGV
jgi:hypothetical protein